MQKLSYQVVKGWGSFGLLDRCIIYLSGSYRVKQLHFVLILERRPAHEHFVNQSAQTPPVNCLSMAFPYYYFWCQIFRSPADSVGLVLVKLEYSLLRESKISEPDMSFVINENILGLKVPVDYAINMKCL